MQPHSRPQSILSFQSAPGIETSGRSRFMSMRRVPFLYFRPIRFVTFDNESLYRGLPVLEPARDLDPWRRPEGSWALRLRMVQPRTRKLEPLSKPLLSCYFQTEEHRRSFCQNALLQVLLSTLFYVPVSHRRTSLRIQPPLIRVPQRKAKHEERRLRFTARNSILMT